MGRRVLLGVLCGAGLLLVLDAIATRAGLAPGAIPELGAPAWITSRAAGVTAFLALTLDVVFGLFVSTGAADRWVARARSVELHRWLSGASLALVGVHALALTADRFVRLDVLDAVVPFLSPYRRFAVALGLLAAYAALLVHLSFGWRRRLGARAWRRLHYLSFLVFAGALAHGVLAGSDSGRDGMRAVYVVAATFVAALAGYRVARARRPMHRGTRA